MVPPLDVRLAPPKSAWKSCQGNIGAFKQITDQTGTGVFVLKVSPIVVKKIKLNYWQVTVDPLLTAVLQH